MARLENAHRMGARAECRAQPSRDALDFQRRERSQRGDRRCQPEQLGANAHAASDTRLPGHAEATSSGITRRGGRFPALHRSRSADHALNRLRANEVSIMSSPRDPWPALPLEAWADTYHTLHMWLQI